jgi:tRNA (mo5U34)-methyltransferase
MVRVPIGRLFATDAVEEISMEIGEIKRKADEFKHVLDAKKKGIAPADFPWYPYNSIFVPAVLKQLLTGKNRFLLDLIGDQPTADIGCADGEFAFFLETLGCRVHAIDNPPTNCNGMQGVKLLKSALTSSVVIHEIDLDSHFSLPEEHFNLIFFMGILYHLKNPFYALETLAQSTRYCVISTRITKFGVRDAKFDNLSGKVRRDKRANLKDIPLAYLVDDYETNNDPTNYWIFTEAGLRRILRRTGWEICDYTTWGNTANSDPASAEGDQRAACLVKSRVCT